MFFKYSHIFMFVSSHIAISLMLYDVCVCVCVNKRDVGNETGEIILENKLWCLNIMLLIVDQFILGKSGQLFSLSLKRKVYVKYGSNS